MANASRTVHGFSRPSTRRRPSELETVDLLLHGLVVDTDEGPGLDILEAVLSVVRGWQVTSDPKEGAITVGHADAELLARRLEVAIELVRRGQAKYPTEPNGSAR